MEKTRFFITPTSCIKWMALLLCLSATAFASESTTTIQCGGKNTFLNLNIQTQAYKGESCTLVAEQGDKLRMANKNRSRVYTFYPNGLIFVFIGTDDYEYMSKSTGSRMFHLLPFKNKTTPSYTEKEDLTIEGILPSGYKASFSKSTGELLSIEGCQVKTSAIEHFDQMVKKQGGIEIAPEKGTLLIDYGWRTGEIPITQLWRTARIQDGYGNKCQIKFNELYDVNPNDKDEVFFKFKTNDELNAFLKKKCPKLNY